MSDLDARRLARELLRGGQSPFDVLASVVEEVAAATGHVVLERSLKTMPEALGILPEHMAMVTHFYVKMIHVPPVKKHEPDPGPAT